MVRVALGAFPQAAAALGDLRDRLRADQTLHGHVAPIFGFICRILGVSETSTSLAFLFVTVRDLFSAATRLSLVGPMEAVRLQNQLHGDAEKIIASRLSAGKSSESKRFVCAWQTDPILDGIHAAHDHLYSRLFVS